MKKKLLLAAKIAFSAGLIFWLLQRADLDKIWLAISSADPVLVLAAFVLFYVGYLIIAKRQQTLLGAQQIDVSIGFLVKSFAIGIFFSNLLPSTIGGDASRMYDIYRVGGSKAKAFSVILIDRFLGMFALVIFGFVAALMSPAIREAIPGIALYLGLILAAMMAVLWVVFGSGARLLEWGLGLNLGPLGFIQRITRKLIEGFTLFKGRTDVLIKALLWSLVMQFNVIIHFIILTRALSIEVPTADMFVIIPIATVLLLAPISINGIGLRDAIFVFLFGIYGVSTEASVAFAWIGLAMILVQGVVGGIVFLFRRRVEGMAMESN